MKNSILSFCIFLCFCQCNPVPSDRESKVEYSPDIPSSIKAEHEHLLGLASALILAGDSSEPEATKLYELMLHHFKEEEDYALPQLGALRIIMNDSIPQYSGAISDMTTKLKAQMVHLNVEHQLISAYLDELKQKTSTRNLTGILELERALHHHAKIEEEVLFPAALLIGDYLQLKYELKK